MADPINHGKAWTAEVNNELKVMFNVGLSVEQIAKELQRKPSSVISQLERMHLVMRIGYGYHKVEADPYWDYRNAKDKK